MSHPIVRRLVVVLALSALLGSPATSMAAGPSSAMVRAPEDRLTSLMMPWSELWSSLKRAGREEYCRITLDKKCPPRLKSDNGCVIDPNGRCLTGH